MEILIAKTAGFCFGVKRAINIAKTSAENLKGEIFTLGPIIHNPQVVKKLEESSSIRSRNTVGEMDVGTVIIRSHGVKLKEFDAAKEKGLNVVDATCPFVKKTQELVSSLTKEGYTVIVVGEKEHPEVQGIISYGAPGIMVATTVEDLKGMSRKKKIGIVAQTTQSQERLQAIASFCLTKAAEVKVCNTICNATSIRQKESVEISKLSDCVVVVGGKNSANTRRLAEICRSIQPRTYHIETASAIDPAWLDGVERLGVTAGASTPNWIIREVIARLEEIAASLNPAENSVP